MGWFAKQISSGETAGRDGVGTQSLQGCPLVYIYLDLYEMSHVRQGLERLRTILSRNVLTRLVGILVFEMSHASGFSNIVPYFRQATLSSSSNHSQVLRPNTVNSEIAYSFCLPLAWTSSYGYILNDYQRLYYYYISTNGYVWRTADGLFKLGVSEDLAMEVGKCKNTYTKGWEQTRGRVREICKLITTYTRNNAPVRANKWERN